MRRPLGVTEPPPRHYHLSIGQIEVEVAAAAAVGALSLTGKGFTGQLTGCLTEPLLSTIAAAMAITPPPKNSEKTLTHVKSVAVFVGTDTL